MPAPFFSFCQACGVLDTTSCPICIPQMGPVQRAGPASAVGQQLGTFLGMQRSSIHLLQLPGLGGRWEKPAGSSQRAGAPPGWAFGWGCWNKLAVVLMSRRGADVPPWCWQPSLVSQGQLLCQAAAAPWLLQNCLLCGSQGLGGVLVFADDFRVLQIKSQSSTALPRCASSLHPGFSGIPVSLLAFPGGCVRAVLKPPNQV